MKTQYRIRQIASDNEVTIEADAVHSTKENPIRWIGINEYDSEKRMTITVEHDFKLKFSDRDQVFIYRKEA